MEIVTFSHFSDVMGGRSFHDVINHNTWLSFNDMAAVFIDPRSLALGAELLANTRSNMRSSSWLMVFWHRSAHL